MKVLSRVARLTLDEYNNYLASLTPEQQVMAEKLRGQSEIIVKILLKVMKRQLAKKRQRKKLKKQNCF